MAKTKLLKLNLVFIILNTYLIKKNVKTKRFSTPNLFNICKTLEWGPDVISASVFLTKFKYNTKITLVEKGNSIL